MRVSPRLLIFETVAFLVFAVLAGAGFLAWRLSQGPIDLEFIRPQVERSLGEARGGRPVELKSLALEWSRKSGRVEAAARELVAKDDAGRVEFKAERAVIALDASALLSGKIKTRRLRLENGQASVDRSKDGVWTLASIVLLKEPTPGEKPFDPVKDLNWTTLATPIRAGIDAGSFERVDLVDFRMEVRDRKTESDWSAYPVNGQWRAGAGGVSLALDMRLAADVGANRVQIGIESDGAVSTAKGKLALEGVNPVVFARMLGFGSVVSFDKPANLTISAEATEAGGLQGSRIELSDVSGSFNAGGLGVRVQDLALNAGYDPDTRRLNVESLKIASDRLTGEFKGMVDLSAMMAAGAARDIPFSLSSGPASFNLVPVFANPWPFGSIELEGTLAGAGTKLVIDRLEAVTGQMTAKASGEVWLAQGEDGQRQVGLKLEAEGNGIATPGQVTDFWPVDVGSQARDWVKTNITAGQATRAVFRVDWPPGANAGGFLPDEHLSLDFWVKDATIGYLEGFPPVTGAVGVGHLKGNSLTVDISQGQMREWIVDEGKVVIPRFAPAGESIRVTASGHGDLRPMMQALDATPLKIGETYGLNIGGMQGSGGVDVEIIQPITNKGEDAPVRYTISGRFRDAALPDIAAGFGLSGSNVSVKVTETGVSIGGAGKFGAAPVVFEWKETLAETPGGVGGSQLTASAKVTPDFLNALGIAARNFMQGEAEIVLRAQGKGRDFASFEADLDLTQAAIQIPEFGWGKAYDSPAKGALRYLRQPDGGATMTADIKGEGLELSGDARLAPSGSMQSARIERIFARDSIDLRGTVSQRTNGGYMVALNGPLFDARPWMDSLLNMSGPSGSPAASSSAPAADHPDNEGAFDITLTTDRLRLRDDADLTEVKMSTNINPFGPQRTDISGLIAPGKYMRVAMRPDGKAQKIQLTSDDAGFAARVLLNTGYFTGGALSFDGRFLDGQGDANLAMTDVRIREAPLLAQLLSVASLRGISDILNGDGVLFTRIDAPMRMAGGRIDLPGLRASGPAMGLTSRGWFDAKSGQLSLDGVLVPSFGMNSALGELPIIGDLFVSRQGEGLFAPIYSVRGDLSAARVSINPLAAVTPGVLRRIFENPAEIPTTADAGGGASAN